MTSELLFIVSHTDVSFIYCIYWSIYLHSSLSAVWVCFPPSTAHYRPQHGNKKIMNAEFWMLFGCVRETRSSKCLLSSMGSCQIASWNRQIELATNLRQSKYYYCKERCSLIIINWMSVTHSDTELQLKFYSCSNSMWLPIKKTNSGDAWAY